MIFFKTLFDNLDLAVTSSLNKWKQFVKKVLPTKSGGECIEDVRGNKRLCFFFYARSLSSCYCNISLVYSVVVMTSMKTSVSTYTIIKFIYHSALQAPKFINQQSRETTKL